MFIKFMDILAVYCFMITVCFCSVVSMETRTDEFDPFKKIDSINTEKLPESKSITSGMGIEEAKKVDPCIDPLLDDKAAFVERLFKGEEENAVINSLNETIFIDGLKRLRQISNSGNLLNQINALIRKRALKKEGKYIIVEDFPKIIHYLSSVKDSKNNEEELYR